MKKYIIAIVISLVVGGVLTACGFFIYDYYQIKKVVVAHDTAIKQIADFLNKQIPKEVNQPKE